MMAEFRAFKRHYNKIKGVAAGLARGESVRLRLSSDGTHTESQLINPQQERMDLFIVLMRRFLNPADPIHYATMWQRLRDEFANHIPADVVVLFDAIRHQMETGFGQIIINQQHLPPHQAYTTIAEGEYFNTDEHYQTYLDGLKTIPFAGQVVWFQFYDYHIKAFRLVEILFKLIITIQHSSDYKVRYSPAVRANPQCIYCLSYSNGFTSEEHVFPETLGNDAILLPPGYVCDQCNNTVLSTLDKELIEFLPIAMRRVMFVDYTKKGKFPRAEFANAVLEKRRPGHIRFISTTDVPAVRETLLDDGQVKLDWTLQGPPSNLSRLARAVYKIALGSLALDYPTEVYDEIYHHARGFVLGERDQPNDVLFCGTILPTPECRSACPRLEDGTPSHISIYGVLFLLRLQSTPRVRLTDDLRTLGFLSMADVARMMA